MITTPESIQKKEESLAALMHKVLQAPLQPLNDAIDSIKNELVSTEEEIVKQIRNDISASLEEIEEVKKSVRGIKNSDIPALKSEIQCISALTERESQKLAESISKHADQYKADLQSTADALLSEAGSQQKQLAQTLTAWVKDLNAGNETFREQQIAITQAVNHQILLNRELTEKIRDDLLNQITASRTVMTSEVAEVKSNFSKEMEKQIATVQSIHHAIASFQELSEASNHHLLDQFNASQHAVADLKNAIESKHSTLVDTLDQQNNSLEQQITLTHAKLRQLIVFFSIFFVLTLTYVGYDIWNRFQ